MALRYRISLPGLKGFARVYELKPDTTLYEFQLAMTSDMDFPRDQLIQFKALDEAGNLVARYSAFDLGAGAIDTVTVSDTVRKGIASFIFFYDVTARKSVIVTYEGVVDDREGVTYPHLLRDEANFIGPNPEAFENGYVAYVDLPEDQKHPKHHDGEMPWGDDDLGDDDDKDFDDDEDDDEDEDEEEEEDDDEGKEVFDPDEGAL